MTGNDYYKSLGLKCGLEIHQQLDSETKLFCHCPNQIRDTKDAQIEFFRFLRPVVSEMGEIDKAAIEQSKLNRKYCYKGYDTTCLVEYDEEPPSEVNPEALEISLVIAKLLQMRPADQVHVMRKIVLDGSNTTGFQRTAFLAGGGIVETSSGDVGIDVLCLEEEAAQKVGERSESIVYSLDRLGIPLVEIGTAPDIISPSHAKETAQQIGMLLRSTGCVKRGLGTIRQDVNISIEKGVRVEIKGVQALDMIETIVEREVERQLNLLKIQNVLLNRKATVVEEIFDVTDIFSRTTSKVIKKALKNNHGKVYGVKLVGFSGIIGEEIQPGRRFGTEISDHAKTSGVGGLFHTDELPKYGITQNELDIMRKKLEANENDALIIVADDHNKAYSAMDSVIKFTKQTLEYGVIESTRRALPDGNSSYMRPLPGAARMYPETDVPPVKVSMQYFNSIKVPELLSEKAIRYAHEFDLNEELAKHIVYSKDLDLFNLLIKRYDSESRVTSTLVVRTLTAIVPELRREGLDTTGLKDNHFVQLFDMIAEGTIAKEAIDDVLRYLCKNPEKTAEDAASDLSLIGVGKVEIEEFIVQLVEEKQDFINEKGMGAVGPLMGIVMKEFRGKVDGQVVNNTLAQKIKEYLSEE